MPSSPKLSLTLAALVALGLVAVHPAAAQTIITVTNGQFQDGLNGYFHSSNDGTFSSGEGTNPDTNHETAYINYKNGLGQLLSGTLILGNTYTLNAFSGQDGTQTAPNGTFGFYDATNGNNFGDAFTQTTEGYTLRTTSFTVGSANAGHNFGIFFNSLGGGTDTLHVANVTASFSAPAAAPEPSQVGLLSLMGLGLGGLLLKARKSRAPLAI
jgi:hypothetical protein